MKKQDLLELINSFPDDTEFQIMSYDHIKKGMVRYHPVRGCGQNIVSPDYSAGIGIYRNANSLDSSNPENKLVAAFY